LRLLLDANLSPRAIAAKLREAGHDVLALAEDATFEGLSDPQVLKLAASEQRVLITRNSVPRRAASMPNKATSKQVTAPTLRPARAPAAAITQPIIGPPIGVEVWKATNHSDINAATFRALESQPVTVRILLEV
jgi:hypothetical protein